MAPAKVFSLEGKSLKLDTGEDLEPHIKELRVMDDVEEVRVLGNTLGIGACKLLGEVLATKKNLQVVNLADLFTGRLLSEIPEALTFLLGSITNLPKLTTVNLNDNAFGLNTVHPLVNFLSSHVPLQHLYLNNNGLGPDAGIRVANALSELHAKKEEARKKGQDVPDLETIICGRNRLENGSMMAWAKTFKLHNKIRTVKMVQNGIRQHGISYLISNGLCHTTGLQCLDLQDNTFTLLGAKALASVAPTWGDMVELGVGDSLLSAKGGILLAEALAKGKNSKLEIIRLQYNDLTAKGINDLAKAAKDALPALKKVEINGNKIAEDDAAIITLQDLFEERKEKLDSDIIMEDEWGLDSLSDLEEEDSEEEEESDEEDVTAEELAEKLIKAAEDAQKGPTVQLKDKEVDELAKKLEKTSI